MATIWETEQGFWLDGPGFYADHMHAEAQMVFPPPAGILTGDAILKGLEQAPRWEAVEMDDRHEVQIGDTLVLAYTATGRRDGARPYHACCSTTYVHDVGGWRLLSHQQTPTD